MIGSLSTLEKRYSFDSKISGLLLIADNVSQVIISPLIGYLGNKYNRPRIMAIGELVAAFSCFVFAAPYFIFGASLQPMTDIITNANSTHELCHSSPLGQPCNQSTVWSAVTILWIASFLNGIGCTAFYTIGIPYIDDNTSKKNSPIFLSTSAALRLFGPALGLLLSSYTLKFYENPQSYYVFKPKYIESQFRKSASDANFWAGVIIIPTMAFAFIPFPLIFGAITDSTCKIWKHTCGKVGNCWLYDIEKLTDYLHYSAFGFMFLGAVCRFFIVLYADRISNMFEDEDEDNEDQTAVALIEDQNNFEDIFFKQK
ncbi:unnamed protein product [Medioppia subpectinata]|uniref:Uncharacterized protein n=1 Tax=Medioppia subpectinata TaxID=1979941 RepID=A0A7R9PVP9_9ACAR|nr:unnamed protein product [Medioppia subpectinata]CAG2102888.1 unnamed protein product [Medioppia subpectinata]